MGKFKSTTCEGLRLVTHQVNVFVLQLYVHKISKTPDKFQFDVQLVDNVTIPISSGHVCNQKQYAEV